MPFDAGGTFTRSYNWQADRDAGIKILAQRMDGEFNNYAGGLNQTFLRTGIVPMGGPLNMNSNAIVGVSGGTLANPGFRFENDTDSGIMSSGPGNVTVVADGVAVLSAASTGITVAGGLTVPGAMTVSGGLNVTGPITATGTVNASAFQIDPAYYFMLNTGNPMINVDNNDYMIYNRAANLLATFIGGVQQFAVSGGNVNVGTAGAALIYMGEANQYYQNTAASAIQVFAPNDLMYYDKAGDTYNWQIGAVTRMTLNASLANFSGNLNAAGNITISGIGSVIGTAVAGNGNVQLITGGAPNSGYISFLRSDGVRQGYLGFAASPTGSISYMNDLGGGHNFAGGPVTTGDIIASGIIKSGTGQPMYPGNDGTYYLAMLGANPYINFDPNDYLLYDRAGNGFNFNINGVAVFAVNAGASYVPTGGAGGALTEVGYRYTPGFVFGGNATAASYWVDRVAVYNGAGTATLTLPSGFPNGASFRLFVVGSGSLILAPGAGSNLFWQGTGGAVLAGPRTISPAGYQMMELVSISDGTAWMLSPGGQPSIGIT